MSCSSGRRSASASTRSLACASALWNVASRPSWSRPRPSPNHLKVSTTNDSTEPMARALASSPPRPPPMPSATTNRWLWSLLCCTLGCARLVPCTARALISRATRNWSWLVGRSLPRSVRPKLRTASAGAAAGNGAVSRGRGGVGALSILLSTLMVGLLFGRSGLRRHAAGGAVHQVFLGVHRSGEFGGQVLVVQEQDLRSGQPARLLGAVGLH